MAILKFRLVHVNVYTFCHVMSCHVSFTCTVSEKTLNIQTKIRLKYR